jgi:hypothetical protein
MCMNTYSLIERVCVEVTSYILSAKPSNTLGQTLGGEGKGIPKEREVDRRREIGEWEG